MLFLGVLQNSRDLTANRRNLVIETVPLLIPWKDQNTSPQSSISPNEFICLDIQDDRAYVKQPSKPLFIVKISMKKRQQRANSDCCGQVINGHLLSIFQGAGLQPPVQDLIACKLFMSLISYKSTI